MTFNLDVSKLCYIVAALLFILSLLVNGPLLAVGLAVFAAGHIF